MEFNEEIRKVYLDKYSENAVLSTMKEAINRYVSD